MDSKKLGMIAAAALTVLATHAQATDNKAPAAKGEEKVCANSCGVAGEHTCAGYSIRAEKTEKACEGKGKWMSKADVLKNQASLKNKKGDAHGHDHKH